MPFRKPYDPTLPYDPNFQNVWDDTQPGEAPRDESGGYALPNGGNLDVYGNLLNPNEPVQTTGQGINEKPPAEVTSSTSTNPNLVQYTGTGLYEGPKNEWGMDASAPQLEGFPQWDTATSLKYRFGREVAKYEPTAENAQKVIQDALAAGWDIRPDDRDPTMFWFNNPQGGWEAVRLLSGNNTWQFNWGSDATGGNPSGAAAAAETAPFPAAQTPTVPTTAIADIPWAPSSSFTGPAATTPATTSGTSALNDAARAELLKMLGQPEINAETLQNDPAVRAQRIQAQRAEERQRAQLMEQNAYEGYADSGAEQTELAGVRQQRSESEAAFIGQLAITQMQARREEIMQAIQVANQMNQFDLSQSLARELAALDASLRREQLQASLADNAAARALQERLANNQLTQQDKQFLLSLGFSYDQLEINANQNAAAPLVG